jgi:pimeloyl-ACP methyl ester carboxylesterase
MRIRLPDFTMEYEEHGNGIPLLLIHGYPLNHTLWEGQIEALSDIARVIAPDLRGHGASDSVPGPYSMDLLAKDCLDLIEALGIQEPIVVGGLSMGGYVAFAFFRQFARGVAGLILAATRPNPDSPEGKANREKSAALARERGTSAIAEVMLPKMLSPKSYQSRPEVVAHARQMMESTSMEGIIGDLLGMKDRPDSGPTLPLIDRPTLILHGADDQLIPLPEAQAMQAAIRDSKLYILPDAGHLLNLEQAELFNKAVKEFLGSL